MLTWCAIIRRWTTRIFGPAQSKDTTDFRDIIKGVLERAENEAASVQAYSANTSPALSQAPFQNYR